MFKDEEERLLWVRLNAERIEYGNKRAGNNNMPMGKIGIAYSCMQVSSNQLEYDEIYCDKPRFSFEELVLPHEELFKLSKERARQDIRKKFHKFLRGD